MRKSFFILILAIVYGLLPVQAQPLSSYGALNGEDCKQWVDSVLKEMSLKDKVGQLFVCIVTPVQTQSNVALLHEAVQTSRIGGLLFSAGKAEDQAQLTNRMQTLSKVPLMITFDGEWGLSMRLQGTPVFPKNMILGCVQDNRLIYEYGKEMARQCREMGVQVNFAPVADVNINPKNPVINVRSFGEVPAMVSDKVISYASGLESGGVLSVAKHFPGHGDTDVDSHKDLPVLPFTRARLDSVELYPFKKVINAGLGGIMVGHLHVVAVDGTNRLPASLSHNAVQGLLKDELGFNGLVFTDALVMKGVASFSNVCLQALKAGNDIVLSPPDFKGEIKGVLQGIERGEISEEEITRKCRKVLAYKYVLGLNHLAPIDVSGLSKRLDTDKTRNLIRQLNEAAVTVLSNKQETLPFDMTKKGKVALLTVGKANETITFANTVTKYAQPKLFQIPKGITKAEGKKLCDSLAQYHTIVCISDKDLTPYQGLFQSITPNLSLACVFFTPKETVLQLGQAVAATVPAVVLGHSANENVQKHIANVLFGKGLANGRIPVSIGNLYRAGEGVTIAPHGSHTARNASKTAVRKERLSRIDVIAEEGIRMGAYPGCQVVVLKDGETVYDKCFGTLTGKGKKVSPTDMYDIASLSKTSATLLAVMKLYDKGLLRLSGKLSDYIPFLKGTDKEHITIRDALLHQSGLPAVIPYYQKAIDEKSYTGLLFNKRYSSKYSVRIASALYAQSSIRLKAEYVSPTPDANYTMQIGDHLWLHKAFKAVAMQEIVNTPLRDKRYRYSCVNFILLQQMVEQISGMPLDKFLAEEFYEPMGLRRTAFQPMRYFSKEDIVPSTRDLFLRKAMVWGYVHDESAAFLGGVSGNAGLFSTAQEIAQIHQMILNGGMLDGRRYLSEDTCRLFTTETSKISHRGLGFNKPATGNPKRNPCSSLAPSSVYGHTGFTGTCAWVDPENNLVYVFLSNRVYPNEWVNKLSLLDIRERIQTAIYQSLQPLQG